MELLDAILLGLLQGLTEFLPVSSSGHLVVAQALLGVQAPGLTFDIALHAGTLLAVLLVYRADVAALVRALYDLGRSWLRPVQRAPGLRRDGPGRAGSRSRGAEPSRRLLGWLISASVPTAAVALLLEFLLPGLFESVTAVGLNWLVTGFVLFCSERWYARQPGPRRPAWQVGAAGALLIGLAQGVAALPGLSRSGVTIAAGLAAGLDRAEAARFSFLLSVVAIGGAALLDVPALLGSQGQAIGAVPLLAGVLAAGLSGLLAIRSLLRLLETGYWVRFAYYTWAAGIAVLIWQGVAGTGAR